MFSLDFLLIESCDSEKAVPYIEMKSSHQHPTFLSLRQAGAPGLPGHRAWAVVVGGDLTPVLHVGAALPDNPTG